MRALVKPTAGPGLELRDVPEPTPGPGEVKIRVQRAGLCGTDLHIDSWDSFAAEHVSPGQIIGHEIFGTIVEIGPDVPEGDGKDAVRIGAGVAVEGHVVCGRCRNCRAGKRHVCVRTSSIGVDRDGGFADYLVVPVTNIWVPPAGFDPALGALFDPFGNAVHTALQFPLIGEDVLVTGAGPIGIMAALISCHAGARNVVLTDISDERLELARKAAGEGVGTLHTLNTATHCFEEVMEELHMTEGFDVCLEMSGSPVAMASAIDHCRHGAKIAMLGLPARSYEVDWNKVITHMLTIKGVYGREMFETWYSGTFLLTSSEALRNGVRATVTHTFAPEDWREAFDTARSGKCGKVTIDWSLND